MTAVCYSRLQMEAKVVGTSVLLCTLHMQNNEAFGEDYGADRHLQSVCIASRKNFAPIVHGEF